VSLVSDSVTGPVRVLVLGGQRTVRMLKERTDYEVLYADENMALDMLMLADFPIETDFGDWDSVIAQVERAHAMRPISAVVTGVDRLVPLAGRLRENLGLQTGITTQAARNCIDKATTQRLLTEAGVPVADYRVVSSTVEGVIAAQGIGLPVVVKPRDATSAIGLMYCASDAEVVEAVAGILADGRDSALVEEYMVGTEVGVFASRVSGRTSVHYVIEAEVGPPPKFVKLGNVFPSRLSADIRAELEKLADRALAAVALDNWVALLQFMITDSGPKAGEINPRVAGGQGVELIAATSGYEPTLVAVEAALGREPVGQEPSAAAGLYRSVVFEEAGKLHYRPEALTDFEGLESPLPPLVEIDVRPGEAVVPMNHARGGAFGRIVIAGQDVEQVERDYQRIMSRLDLRVVPEVAAEAQVERAHSSCC
jgi:carbamoylphosphate synthase large subunit